jgi:hypothetical protein
MLFHVTWEFTDTSEDGIRRSLEVFSTAPWVPWLRFTMNPIVPIEESSAIAGEAVAFRDSVG